MLRSGSERASQIRRSAEVPIGCGRGDPHGAVQPAGRIRPELPLLRGGVRPREDAAGGVSRRVQSGVRCGASLESNRNMDAILRSLVRNAVGRSGTRRTACSVGARRDRDPIPGDRGARRAMSGYETWLNELRNAPRSIARRWTRACTTGSRASARCEAPVACLASSDGPVCCLMPAGAPLSKNAWRCGVLGEPQDRAGGRSAEAR